MILPLLSEGRFPSSFLLKFSKPLFSGMAVRGNLYGVCSFFLGAGVEEGTSHLSDSQAVWVVLLNLSSYLKDRINFCRCVCLFRKGPNHSSKYIIIAC